VGTGELNQARPQAAAMAELASALRKLGTACGLAAVGFAPAAPMEKTRHILEERKAAGLSGGMQFTYRNPARSTDPGRVVPGAQALVVGALAYANPGYEPSLASRRPRPTGGDGSLPDRPDGVLRRSGPPDEPRPMGVVARYARQDHYGRLRSVLTQLAAVLGEAGWLGRVVVDDNALVDRAAAERAGIGWFGKNSNILLPGRGSWFLLGSVVTDAPLPAGTPVQDGCGACRRCLASCPTGALVAPGVLDARRCLAWLLQAPGVFPFEYREALAGRVYGCDDCQEVCPVNRAAARPPLRPGPGPARTPSPATVPSPAPSSVPESETSPGQDQEEGQADLLQILDRRTSDAELLDRYGRWYIPERDPRYLRRNAILALGNVGDAHAPAVEQALLPYLLGPDELLRAHAIWAAARLGREDLVSLARPSPGSAPLVEQGSAPLVEEELRRLPSVNRRCHAA
jgi:epoxyqueuosine reductase